MIWQSLLYCVPWLSAYLKDKWDLVMKMYSYTLSLQGIALIGDIITDIGMRVSMWFIVRGLS